MKKCLYCGKEYSTDAVTCAIDGMSLVMVESPSNPQQRLRVPSFFRWRPTTIILGLLAVLFGSAGVLNIWLAFQPIAKSEKIIKSLWIGTVENFAITALCLLGWALMRRRTSMSLSAGALSVCVALTTTSIRWCHWEFLGKNTLPWAEPLLVWPLLVYAMIYGYNESKGQC